MSVENWKQLHATLCEAKKELKDDTCPSKKQKSLNQNILLTERGNHFLHERMLKFEMHVLEEGNIKCFHDSFM